MARKLRLLVLLDELSRTGASRGAIDVFEAMPGEFEIRTMARKGRPLAEDYRAIGEISILPDEWVPSRDRQGPMSRIQRSRWSRGLRGWDPDLIYINGLGSIPMLQWLPVLDAPAMVHVRELHTEIIPIMKACPELLLQRPHRYLAVSQCVREALVDECGIDGDRIEVINDFIPERRRSALNSLSRRPRDGTVVIGGAGYPTWSKGTTLWLQMAK